MLRRTNFSFRISEFSGRNVGSRELGPPVPKTPPPTARRIDAGSNFGAGCVDSGVNRSTQAVSMTNSSRMTAAISLSKPVPEGSAARVAEVSAAAKPPVKADRARASAAGAASSCCAKRRRLREVLISGGHHNQWGCRRICRVEPALASAAVLSHLRGRFDPSSADRARAFRCAARRRSRAGAREPTGPRIWPADRFEK